MGFIVFQKLHVPLSWRSQSGDPRRKFRVLGFIGFRVHRDFWGLLGLEGLKGLQGFWGL